MFLPDCSLEDAAVKAEQIRERIQAPSGNHGAKGPASLGVFSVASTSSNSADLVKAADTALYRATHDGRNRSQLLLSDQAGLKKARQQQTDRDASVPLRNSQSANSEGTRRHPSLPLSETHLRASRHPAAFGSSSDQIMPSPA